MLPPHFDSSQIWHHMTWAKTFWQLQRICQAYKTAINLDDVPCPNWIVYSWAMFQCQIYDHQFDSKSQPMTTYYSFPDPDLDNVVSYKAPIILWVLLSIFVIATLLLLCSLISRLTSLWRSPKKTSTKSTQTKPYIYLGLRQSRR